MATDVERLAVLIEANTRSYDNAMRRLETKTDKAIRAARRSVQSLDRQLSMMSRRATQFAAAIGVGFSLRGFQDLLDTSTRVGNSLRVAGLEGDALKQVYDRLFASAQQNAAPIEALTQLYGRAALVQKELGASTEDMLRFTDKVAVALRVSGRSAQESSGALLQLSQALGSGIVRAEEFNSILEGALPIAQAAAAGLKETGGSVAALRTLVIGGEVSSKAFFDAFLAGSRILDEKVTGAQLTVAQGFVKLQNVLIDSAGKLDKVAGASVGASSGLGALADAISGLTKDEAKLKRYVELIERAALAFAGARIGGAIGGPAGALVGGIMGVTAPEVMGGGVIKHAPIVDGMSRALGIDSISKLGSGSSSPSPTVSPVSLADYGIPAGGSAGKLGKPLSLLPSMLDRATNAQDALNDSLERTAQLGESAFSTLISGLREGKSFGDAFGDALANLEDQLLQMATNAAIRSLLAAFFPGGAAVGGGGFSGGIGFGLGQLTPRAGGGPVSAGQAYLVGEKGPELFIPKAGGAIAANSNISGGAMAPVVQVINNSGSPARTERSRVGGRDMVKVVVGEVKAGIGRGDFDSALGGRMGARPRLARTN